MIECAPGPKLILSIQSQGKLTWPVLLGEAIDNSFDADATVVTITFEKDRLIIEDNGRGCEDLLVMIVPGRRKSHPRSKLGRYGSGVKDLMLNVGDKTSIRSVSNGILRTTHVDWDALLKMDRWMFEEPSAEASGEPSGTRLVLSVSHKKPPKDKDALYKVIQALSRIYTPAILAGKQIRIRWKAIRSSVDTTVPAEPSPNLSLADSDTLHIRNHRVKVRMGLLRPEDYHRSGTHISLEYRIIGDATRTGLGGEPAPALYAEVFLEQDWPLAKNKDMPGLLDELGEAMEGRFAQIIREAGRKSQSVLVDEMNDIISRTLASVKRGKGKRRPTNHDGKKGTQKPTGEGAKHTQAKETQAGDTFPIPKSCTEFKFNWTVEDSPDVYRYQKDPTNKTAGALFLNEKHPFCASLLKNNPQARLLLEALVLAIYSIEGAAGNTPRYLFPDVTHDNYAELTKRFLSEILANYVAIRHEDMPQSEDA